MLDNVKKMNENIDPGTQKPPSKINPMKVYLGPLLSNLFRETKDNKKYWKSKRQKGT